jgi:hypothetical protein
MPMPAFLSVGEGAQPLVFASPLMNLKKTRWRGEEE